MFLLGSQEKTNFSFNAVTYGLVLCRVNIEDINLSVSIIAGIEIRPHLNKKGLKVFFLLYKISVSHLRSYWAQKQGGLPELNPMWDKTLLCPQAIHKHTVVGETGGVS